MTDPVRTRPDEPQEDRALPAGRVLQVVLLALCLAALFNADAMVDRAERRDFGWRRDVSVWTWSRVADVSHLLSLDHPRALAEEALGREGDDELFVLPPAPAPGPAPSPSVPGGGATTTTTTTLPAPTVRAPTPEEPLRTWVGGDSMAQTFGYAMYRAMAGSELFAYEDTPGYTISSGLTRPDFFDWPGELARIVAEDDPELMVVIFGANDSQGIQMDDGRVFERNSPEWLAEYRRRVAGTMDLLRDPEGDRLVVWVGQPVMRDSGFSQRMAYLNNIYWEEAASRPWVRYFDTWPYFTDGTGAYAPSLAAADGTVADMRVGDGIHFTNPGGDRLAWAVLGAIGELVDLSAADVTPPAGVVAPPEVHERDVVPRPDG